MTRFCVFWIFVIFSHEIAVDNSQTKQNYRVFTNFLVFWIFVILLFQSTEVYGLVAKDLGEVSTQANSMVRSSSMTLKRTLEVSKFLSFTDCSYCLKITKNVAGFQKLAKLTIFGIFNELLSTKYVKVARFARNVECDFFRDFQTLCNFILDGWRQAWCQNYVNVNKWKWPEQKSGNIKCSTKFIKNRHEYSSNWSFTSV